MKLLTFLICILNLIAFIFYDYEYRIDRSLYFATNFIFRDYVEILCYSYYTLEVLLKIIATGFIFGPNTYMRDGWHIFFIITLTARFCFKNYILHINFEKVGRFTFQTIWNKNCVYVFEV